VEVKQNRLWIPVLRSAPAGMTSLIAELITREGIMKKGEKLVVIGCGGVGGPAAMMAKKLMPDVDVTIIRKEDRFIVR
jgi:D-arabinose 1-dehydrogenase-like Zn-dependent alcohol dehydrogenase